jgi:uncharacterized protein HemX
MKALTLILAILAILGSAASGFFWWQIGDTKKQLQSELSASQTKATNLEGDLAKAAEERTRLVTNLSRTDGELGDVKRSLTAAEARNVQIGREAETLRQSVAAKTAAEKKLNEDLDVLRRELVQTRLAAQVGNPEEIERYKQTIATLEARVAELQAAPAAGSRPASSSSFTAPAASTTPGSSESAAAVSDRTASARIAQVGPRNAFVILELGSADGIVAGNRFNLVRDGKTIAEATVSSVQASFVVAQIAPSSIQAAPVPGDSATLVR